MISELGSMALCELKSDAVLERVTVMAYQVDFAAPGMIDRVLISCHRDEGKLGILFGRDKIRGIKKTLKDIAGGSKGTGSIQVNF
jgi:hypothetical protein